MHISNTQHAPKIFHLLPHILGKLPFCIPFVEIIILKRLFFLPDCGAQCCPSCASYSQKYEGKLSSLIKSNNVAIYLYTKFVSDNHPILPTSLTTIISTQAISQILLNSLHRKENGKILKHLVKNNVHFVFLKPYAYSFAYDKTENKYVHDLDLLIPTSEYLTCRSALEQIKYSPVNRSASTSPFFHIPTQESFSRNTNVVEIHTSIMDDIGVSRFFFPQEKALELCNVMFTRTRMLQKGSLSFKTLNPTDMILSHFLHIAFQHNYQQIARYEDIRLFIAKYSAHIQWHTIQSIVKQYDIYLLWEWYVALCIYLFPTMLPTAVVMRTVKAQKKWSFSKKLLFFYMKQEIFYPTIFSMHESKEKFKTFSFHIITRSLKAFLWRSVKGQIH